MGPYPGPVTTWEDGMRKAGPKTGSPAPCEKLRRLQYSRSSMR